MTPLTALAADLFHCETQGADVDLKTLYSLEQGYLRDHLPLYDMVSSLHNPGTLPLAEPPLTASRERAFSVAGL